MWGLWTSPPSPAPPCPPSTSPKTSSTSPVSKHDHAGAPAPVGPKDTHSVAGHLLFSTPQSHAEALREVHPPPHPQCLHHLMFRGLFLPPGQFQAQALWPGLGGRAHPSHRLTQRGETRLRAGGHTRTGGARRAQTQVRSAVSAPVISLISLL